LLVFAVVADASQPSGATFAVPLRGGRPGPFPRAADSVQERGALMLEKL